MAYGDVGGAVTELVITCKTPAAGDISIAAGDAVKLTGAYTVDHAAGAEDPVFGEALADVAGNNKSVAVKVRGVCIFNYDGDAPLVDGQQGVTASGTAGKVKAPATGNGRGLNVKVDAAASKVHVLL
jgi:hypothetical protein